MKAGTMRTNGTRANFRSVQATLADRIEFRGTGVHSGAPVSLVVHPAPANHGIVFLRAAPDGDAAEIPASFDLVSATELCTVVGDRTAGAVSTVEHLLAALTAYGVDNALIEVDADEVPILDGSAWPFVDEIERVGLRRQETPRRYLKVLKPVMVERGASRGALLPFEGTRYEVEIDFDSALIGRQVYSFDLAADAFRRNIARARTFGFLSDVERLWAMGFARGASLENTVALGEGRILNPEGLRYPDEFVRHKVLDAIGDLSLAGLPILGLYRSVRPGHRLNLAVLQALFADESAFAIVELGGARRDREPRHAELHSSVAVAALAPEAS